MGALLPTTIRIRRYRPDTLDFLDRIEAAGGAAPDKITAGAINRLKQDIKLQGLDTLPGHLHAALGDLPATRLNLLNTSYTATPVQGSEASVNDLLVPKKYIQGNGIDSCLLTGYNPFLAGALQNGSCIGAAFTDDVTSSATADMGCSDTVNSHGTLFNPRTASNQAATRINAQTTHNVAGSTGVATSFTAVRTTSALYSLYKGAGFTAAFGGGGQTSTGVPNQEMAIGAIGRSTLNTFSLRKFSLWWAFGRVLTIFEVGRFHLITEQFALDMGARA
jgi:hypothetical protein